MSASLQSSGRSLPAWGRWLRARRGLIAAAAAVLLTAAFGVWLWRELRPERWHYYTDDLSVRHLGKDVRPRLVLWEPASAAPGPLNAVADDADPAILADGVTMVVTRGAAAGNADLFVSRWDGREWSEPAPLPALNSKFNELGCSVSPDGRYLVFASDRPGGLGGYDLWVARWDGVTWAWPANLGYMVNSKFDDIGPAVSSRDGRLFFASNRPGQRLTDEEDAMPVRDLRGRYRSVDFDLYAADAIPAGVTNREIERLQSQLYSLRTAALSDETVMAKLGGTRETEKAVDMALAWLARAQESNGCWSAAKWGTPDGHDVGITGFALLAFLGRGHRHNRPGPYQTAVDRALRYLTGRTRMDGDMRRGEAGGAGGCNMYDQGIGTLALTEAYGVTKDDGLYEHAQAAVNFLAEAQYDDGGWRYEPRKERAPDQQRGDLSVSGWQIMALKSAELSGLFVPRKTLARARDFVKAAGKGEYGGRYVYQPSQPGDGGDRPAMLATGFFVSQLLGISPNTRRSREAESLLLAHVPERGKADIYFWYNAILASYQFQSQVWDNWNRYLTETFLPLQVRTGELAGSWDPGPGLGGRMGRVGVTALFALSMQVYYRYTPLYGLGFKPRLIAAGQEGWDEDRIPEVPCYSRARPIEALNSAADDVQPSVTPRGDFIYFASRREGGLGGFDLYRSHITESGFEPPVNLGPEINSSRDETGPATRMAGFNLVYSSNRDGPDPSRHRLYASVSRHVFREHSYARRPDRAQVLGRYGWELAGLALAVAVFAGLVVQYAVLRRERGGGPS